MCNFFATIYEWIVLSTNLWLKTKEKFSFFTSLVPFGKLPPKLPLHTIRIITMIFMIFILIFKFKILYDFNCQKKIQIKLIKKTNLIFQMCHNKFLTYLKKQVSNFIIKKLN